jgi:capsular exopolysaccharide synthesis family protein
MLAANAVADLYLVEQLEATFEITQRATVWLGERLADLRAEVEMSESAVEAFREQAGLIEGAQSSLAAQQISELSTQQILARSARAEAEARLRQVTNLVNSSDSLNSVAEVLASPLIQSLREQEAEVDRRIAELSNEYGEKHPRMINIKAEMTDLQGKIASEVDKVVQNLRNEVSVARAREGSLSASLRTLEQRVAGLNSSEIRLRALQREATANRELYETFLARFKETSTQGELQQPAARIIARAELSPTPSYPRKGFIVVLVFIISIFLGVVLAFAIEQLDHGFRSMDQIEQMIGLPSLGLVPVVKKGKGTPERFAVENPLSNLGEAIRTIYTAVVLSNVGQPPKVVLVTSALPKEGKTTIALLLGRVCALLGKRTIIIDADLRRPQIHSRLDLPAAPGLVELLTGETTAKEAIFHDEASGADIIPVGKTSPNAAELLNSDRLESILELISQDYDLVILDSPPSMAVADARVLTHLADATILVVRWAATRREVAAMAAKQIKESGGNIAGVVLSRVNVRQHAPYGYGDSGIYYGPSQEYYSG